MATDLERERAREEQLWQERLERAKYEVERAPGRAARSRADVAARRSLHRRTAITMGLKLKEFVLIPELARALT